jgi:glycosyltransferase involved in cell wall biosynthesis
MKWGALHACEAFVLPSHQENFGIAVAEALACSKPVLISNKVNIWEQVVQDGAALVEEDSQAGTFNLLDRWIKLNPNKRAKMGSDAYLCFLRRYDMKENARSIADLFTEIRDIALDGKHSY